jgi:5-methylcytosine-specific restriction endonuclease McrA
MTTTSSGYHSDMALRRCIGCDQDFDPAPRRSDVKHCSECEPLRHHRYGRRRLPVALLRSLGSVCAICGDIVDLNRHYPDPLAPSVDHIVPIRLGGTHDGNNLQMAHLRCNQAKHLRRLADDGERHQRQLFYNQRRWRKLAARLRSEEPTCRQCGAASTCASHIVPLADGGAPWDASNIEALCRRCRNRKAQTTYHSSL